MSRTITEIFNESAQTYDLKVLIMLRNEIANNNREYPLSEIWDANVYIRERSFLTNSQDIDKSKFYLELKSQCPVVH